MSSKNVLIVGSGAVGCFYGSRLHLAPNTLVSLVCRSNYKAVKSNGVSLRTHSYGDYHFAPAGVYDSVASARAANITWHYVVVTTKALPDISDDSSLVEPVVGPATAIVLIQNGVGVEAPYRARFPRTPILSGVTVVSAAQVEPGVVVQNRWTRLSLGPYVGEGGEADLTKRSTTANDDFAKRLTEGGIKDVETYDEQGLQLVRWHKLVINASMNPSAVLSGGTGNSRMSLDPELRIHLKGCMDELFDAVPRIVGRPFTDKMAKPDRILTSSERNTEGLPSMLLDWRKTSPLELEVILGNPVREARRKGVELPRLQSMYALLKMAQTRRQEDAAEAKRGSSKL